MVWLTHLFFIPLSTDTIESSVFAYLLIDWPRVPSKSTGNLLFSSAGSHSDLKIRETREDCQKHLWEPSQDAFAQVSLLDLNSSSTHSLGCVILFVRCQSLPWVSLLVSRLIHDISFPVCFVKTFCLLLFKCQMTIESESDDNQLKTSSFYIWIESHSNEEQHKILSLIVLYIVMISFKNKSRQTFPCPHSILFVKQMLDLIPHPRQEDRIPL